MHAHTQYDSLSSEEVRGTFSRFDVQAIYLVLAKGLVAYLFTLLLCALLIVTVVIEGASARGVQDSAQFDGHDVGYAIAFGW